MSPAENYEERPPVGNLTDFVLGVDDNNPLDIEVAVNDAGKVVVFHNREFKSPISWFEFDLTASRLSFILEDGQVRDAGLPLNPAIAKHMQNSHQILTVYMDDDSGEAREGHYIPLIIQKV